LQFSNIFSDGAATPSPGATPYMTAEFTDAGANTVSLTVTPHLYPPIGLPSGAKIDQLYFNVVSAPSTLSVVFNSASSPGVGTPTSSYTQAQTFKADGDGWFNIFINFPTGGSSAFSPGETAVFTLTGTGITANSFNRYSLGPSNWGPFLAAAHVNAVNAGDSTWLYAEVGPPTGGGPPVVPLPAAAWAGLTTLGMIGGLGWIRRRRMGG
jgi:hypothetical protein